MKKTIIILALSLMMGCNQPETAIDQINNCVPPVIVFSKHTSKSWDDYPDQFTVRDGTGKLIELYGVGRSQLEEKYNIGDTIK